MLEMSLFFMLCVNIILVMQDWYSEGRFYETVVQQALL